MLGDALAREREELEDEIGGRTLVDVLEHGALSHPNRIALEWQDGGRWRTLTWAEYRLRVLEMAAALIEAGIEPGATVAIMMSNRPEHLIADLGAVHAGAVPVTFYETLAPAQIAAMAADCAASVAFVETLDDKARWEASGVERFVVVDNAAGTEAWETFIEGGRRRLASDSHAVAQVASHVTADDLATLIYTSGTTGAPKGVMLSHRNVLWAAASFRRAIPVEHPRLVSYLPLAHMAERMASHYLGLVLGAHITLCAEISGVLEVMQHARPEVFLGVPRIWQKLKAGVEARVASQPEARQRLVGLALEVGRAAAEAAVAGTKPTRSVVARNAGLERLVASKVRAQLGLDRVAIAISGAAPIDPELIWWANSLGIPLVEVFGLTETTAAGTVNVPGFNQPGTVGRAAMGIEIRIAEDGELWIRGDNVAQGYHNNPVATREAFHTDGWMMTGDLASLDPDGYVTIIGRKKEIIVNAAGKNIAPAHLEQVIGRESLIAHVCLVGEGRRYLTALVALDEDELATWAERADVGGGYPDWIGQPEVERRVAEAVDAANETVSKVEQVKKHLIVGEPWTPQGGQVTPSLKLRRAAIYERYEDLIETLYVD